MSAQPQLIEVAEREVVLADFVPFSSHVTDHVIRTSEGDYLRVWKIAGIAFSIRAVRVAGCFAPAK